MSNRIGTKSDTGLRRRIRQLGAGLAACSMLALAAPAAWAHPHDPDEAGHPLAIIAAILHPIGVLLDYTIFRPAHWLVHHEPLKTLEGHED